jgi:hypothetical protein
VQTLSRELHAMVYRRVSARPRHHAQAIGAIDVFREPLIVSTIPSVFHGHGDPGLISANVDGFTPYLWGRNPRAGRLQTQFTCQA